MRTCKCNKLLRKILLMGILSLGVTVMNGQGFFRELGKQFLKNLAEETTKQVTNYLTGGTVSNGTEATNSIHSHLNNRCSSGTVYVIQLYESGRPTLTAYYCENERSEFESCFKFLNTSSLQGQGLRVERDVIYNSSSGNYTSSMPAYTFGGRSYSSAEERDAAEERYNEEQAEIARKAEEARLLFEAGKQELLEDLLGMDNITTSLEVMANSLDIKGLRLEPTTGTFEFIGLEQQSNSNNLDFIDYNSSNLSSFSGSGYKTNSEVASSASQIISSGILIDDTKGLPVVDYRPSGIIMPETQSSINESSIFTNNAGFKEVAIEKKNKDWNDWYIDAAKFGLGIGTDLIKGLSFAESSLISANINLYTELGHAINRPEDYIGWNGTKKILVNALVNTAIDVGISNSAKIAGTYSKAVKTQGGVPATLSYTERRILVSGQKVLETGTKGYDAGDLMRRGHNLTVANSKDKWGW